MGKISFYIFGYRVISVSVEHRSELLSLFLKLGVSSVALSSSDFIVSRRDYIRISSFLSRTFATVSDERGLPSFFLKARARLPVLAALILVGVLNYFLSGLVWDIRISGNTSVPDYLIKEALMESGLSVGSLWSRLDCSMIEAETSSSFSEIGWVNINRRGTVAYVVVVERAPIPTVEDFTSPPCNIVAAVDCVIEDIDVLRGVACVSPGDVVRRGDILISGVVDTGSAVSFVAAEGTVTGQVGGTVSASSSRHETVKSVSGRNLSELRLNIFNFSVNIFKNYRNSDNTCDIIEKNESFVVNDEYRLPFGLTKIYSVRFEELVREYTDSELVTLAIGRHNAALAARIADGELLKISTSGDFTDGGYTVSSDIVYSVSVGERVEIVEN